MMSLPVWLTAPMFLLEVSVFGLMFLPGGRDGVGVVWVSVSGSLSRGSLSGGLCLGNSVWESLSGGSLFSGETPVQ